MFSTDSDALLKIKLQAPQSYTELIQRPRLLDRLDNSLRVPLTLISAPAGYGKTTLVSQWLERIKRSGNGAPHTAWLSLDPQDGEPVRFLTYFVAALRTISPDACPRSAQLLRGPDLPPEQQLLTLLVNEIDNLSAVSRSNFLGHLVLILDDFDSMHSEAANRLLHTLLQFPPPHFHLILTCRRDPRLPLTQLNAQQKLVEVRSRDLRLTHDEIQEFVRLNFRDGGAGINVDALASRSEGWFAILRLMSLVLRDSAGTDMLARLPDGHQDIARFFVEQVLARQSVEMRRCLIKASIFERFTADLCEHVCGMPSGGGAEFLNRLKSENLFLLSLDNQGVWFRFQPLFRQLLQMQFRIEYGDAEQAEFHRRASAWFRKHNYPEETIKHALSAGDVSGAVTVFAQYRHELMADDRWNLLESVLRMFPPEALSQYPDLLLTQAWLAHTQRHDFQTLSRTVQETLSRLRKSKLPQKRLRELRAECDVLTAMRLFVRESDAPGAIRLIQRALQVLPRDKYQARSIAWINLSAAYQMEGESEQAHRVLREALVEDEVSNGRPRATLFGAVCFVHWMDGDLRALEERAKQVLFVSSKSDLPETTAWASYFAACAQYEQDNLAEAEQNARRVFHEYSPAGLAPLANSAFILASCCLARNQPDRARQTLDELEQLLLERRSEIFLSRLGAFRAEMAVRQGNIVAARYWHETGAQLSPESSAMHLFYAPQLTAPLVLLAINTPGALEKAEAALDKLLAFVRGHHNKHFLIPVLAMQALLWQARGKRDSALEILSEAVLLGERSGARRSILDLGPRLLPLLRQLKAQGVAPAYLGSLLEREPVQKVQVLVTPDSIVTQLTEREHEVLRLLSRRMSNKEIANQLFISPLTVKVHTDHIYQKFNVNNRRDAVLAALTAGILKDGDMPA